MLIPFLFFKLHTQHEHKHNLIFLQINIALSDQISYGQVLPDYASVL